MRINESELEKVKVKIESNRQYKLLQACEKLGVDIESKDFQFGYALGMKMKKESEVKK